MKKIKNIILNIVFNLVILSAVYCYIFDINIYVSNIFVVWVWVYLVLSLSVFIFNIEKHEDVSEKLYKKFTGNWVFIFDIIIIFALSAFQHYLFTVVWIVSTFFQYSFTTNLKSYFINKEKNKLSKLKITNEKNIKLG